jgi:hypothetical protein
MTTNIEKIKQKIEKVTIKHFILDKKTYSTSSEFVFEFAKNKLLCEIKTDLPNNEYVGEIATHDSFAKRFGLLFKEYVAQKERPLDYKKAKNNVLAGYNIQNYILNIEMFHDESTFFYDKCCLLHFCQQRS